MAKLGADVAGLDSVAVDLDRFAATVERAQATVDAQLRRTAWTGPDADAFRAAWRRIGLVDLGGLRAELAAAAQHVRRQADEQRLASGDQPTVGSDPALAGVSDRILIGGMIGAGMLQPAAGSGALGPGGPGTPLGPPSGSIPPPRSDGYRFESTEVRGAGFFGAGLTTLSTLASLPNVPALSHLPLASATTRNALPPGVPGHALVGLASAALTFGTVGINSGFERYYQELNAGRTSSEATARAVGSGVYQGGTAAAGKWAGAKAGAALGFKVGMFLGPKGAAVGGVVGGAIGAIGGSELGSAGVEWIQGTELGQGLDDAAAWAGGAVADAAQAAGDLVTDVGGSIRDLGSGLTDTIGGWFR